MKKEIIRFITGAILFIVAIGSKFFFEPITIYLFIASYIVVGYDVVIKAFKNIFRGKMLDEHFLMSLATLGAFFLKEYPEAVAVMLFYQLGELFQNYAVNKSRRTISSLMDIRPDYANLIKNDKLEKVDPYDVEIGDIILVKPGEKVPLDGIIEEGTSMVDTSALTGESVPRSMKKGKEILSGCINQTGVIKIKVTKEFGESTVSKILDIVENASSRKAKSEKFITKFAMVYTPFVVISAILLAAIPTIISHGANFDIWLYRALTFLVVSCPCALVISIPLSFFGGIGGASKQSILIKGSNFLEALSKTEIVIFDKTGTLTKGVFEVQEIHSLNIDKEKLLEYTALAESHSTHPISLSLQKAYNKKIDSNRVKDIQEISGHGLIATVDNKRISVGNAKLMRKIIKNFVQPDIIGTVVHVAIDNEYCGYILIADEIKSDSKIAVEELKKNGVKKTVMLTGDAKSIGEDVARKLNIDEAYTELLPTDKVNKEEELLKTLSKKGKLAFVGDGINDAPVLALSDIGIAMGGVGSDAAIEAADVVIMTDEPSKIATAINISRKTLKIVKQNITFALFVKFSVLILSAFGFVNMWLAIFADVGVSVIAIINSLRALNTK